MRQFGLIGFPLSHSFSQKYFTEKFLKENITDAAFLNFSIPDIADIENIFRDHPSLQGLAVTIPYKKSVIPYLNSVDDAVKEMSACNCIKIRGEIKTGFNTDTIGFEKSFVKQLKPHHKKALILGTGGASAAIQYVLKKLNIEYLLASRNKSLKAIAYSDISPAIFLEFNIIINCTPLGTYPDTGKAPLLPYNLLTPEHYLYDLVYNPPLTKFLQYGKEAGCTIKNGYEMLELQAEENWKIWNS
ncbi:shikimate dehydrogenase family protein [Parafilimonas terrae]|jgi:shikimate dehydrogenase|uniref:Shikimate dehydrogenase n=1 Tax=Parafilimonas terrae TaxID=1465490 RepID=A0A1I5YAN1_9BACT|nr:shikimate dehydrogenase [Parafilimonas terrae]SFQ41248.1 shikimate dehydrogenase [Parafilimonas terrae]